MEWRFESAQQIYPSTMREEFMATLHRYGTPDSDFASAELIYGELISNVIRHARGKIRVRLEWSAEFPTLWVHDEERYFAKGFELPSDPLAESGRGLYIVKALAKDFRLTRDGGDGSIAQAILPVRRSDGSMPDSEAATAN